MKTNYYVFFIALLAAVTILLAGCDDRPDDSGNGGGGERGQAYNVKLDVRSEVVELDEGSPMTSVSGGDSGDTPGGAGESGLDADSGPVSDGDNNSLYGVQIYSRNAASKAASSRAAQSAYVPYGYGIFDDPSKIEVTLYDEVLYKFVVTKIVDGKARIPKQTNGAYRQPLLMTGSLTSGVLTNKITLSSNCFFSGLGVGTAALSENGGAAKFYDRPTVDRYYGELVDFKPAKGAASPVVDLSRVVFGVDFLVEGLSEGSLEVILKGAPPIIFESGQSDRASHIFTLNGTLGNSTEWIQDTYYESVLVTIKWTKQDGSKVEIANESLLFKRKHKYNMTIKLTQLAFDSAPAISTEDAILLPGEDITF